MYLPRRHFWNNDKALLALKDIHRGERCFIVGNGPSLKVEDLHLLQDEFTLASNRIWLAFDQTAWRPTYYTLCDMVVARGNQQQVRGLDLPKIFGHGARRFFHDLPGAVFVNPPRKDDLNKAVEDSAGVLRIPNAGALKDSLGERLTSFLGRTPPTTPSRLIEEARGELTWPASWNLLRGARDGHSVVNLGLKIAYWMGFDKVYAIGCDHSFDIPKSKTGERVSNNDVIRSQGERNHFHKDYRRPDEEWTFPQLDIMAEEFAYARKVYEADARTIKNASRFTKLEAWERVDFDTLFPQPAGYGRCP